MITPRRQNARFIRALAAALAMTALLGGCERNGELRGPRDRDVANPEAPSLGGRREGNRPIVGGEPGGGATPGQVGRAEQPGRAGQPAPGDVNQGDVTTPDESGTDGSARLDAGTASGGTGGGSGRGDESDQPGGQRGGRGGIDPSPTPGTDSGGGPGAGR